MLAGLSASGAHGTLVQIVDPAEESFPYSGRIEFVEPEGGGVITAGRAERWAGDYVARVALHRDEIRSETNKLDWLFSTHTTSRSAAELLLFLHSRHDGEQGQRAHRDRQSGAKRMIAGLPLSFAEPILLLGLLSLPRAVVAVAGDAAAAAAHRVPADAAVVRYRAEGRNPVAHAMVADGVAPAGRGAGDLGRRRTDLESANRPGRLPARRW